MENKIKKWTDRWSNNIPSPVTHGYFNRYVFTEALLYQGTVAMTKQYILEYTGMTRRELDIIIKEAIEDEFLFEEKPHFLMMNEAKGEVVYRLNKQIKTIFGNEDED